MRYWEETKVRGDNDGLRVKPGPKIFQRLHFHQKGNLEKATDGPTLNALSLAAHFVVPACDGGCNFC